MSVADVIAVVGRSDALLPWPDAAAVARALARGDAAAAVWAFRRPLFREPDAGLHARAGLPLAISSALHVGVLAAVILLASLAPHAAALAPDQQVPNTIRLVFLVAPGPGGGGGGGGARQTAPAVEALTRGHHTIRSPLPIREPLKSALRPPQPQHAALAAEQLPVVMAPVVAAPADSQTRPGVLTAADGTTASRGPGRNDGVGTGVGTGLGEGDGSGIGPGTGGGTGGGAYGPGSGIEPPRLLREVKADYTDDARQRGLQGDVLLEIVVRRDGTVGDVRVLQGLEAGLNDRAINAVRQWRFAPARRLGAPVDVVVQVSVEFRLR